MRSSNWALRLSVLLLLLACGIECAKNRHFKHSHKKDDQQQNDDEDRREDNNSPQTYGDDGQIAPKFGQSGREYRFRFDSQTASGYASWISTQRAMSRFQALVSVKFLSDKEAEMRISECLAGQLNSKPVIDSWDPARIQPVAAFESNNKFQHEEMERPIRFSYEQGAINKIRFSPEEPSWSKNVKKGVLNMMQLQLAKDVVQQKRNPVEKIIERELRQQTNTVGGKPQQQQQGQREEGVFSTELEKSFSLSEMTIEGDCECQYTMVPINSGELLNVTKSVNFDRCRLLADVAFGMQADEEAKQRGGQEEERNMNSEYKHDWLANIGLSEMQQAEAQMRNRSGSPTIAKQFLDRSTTIRYVLSNQQQQQQKKQSNGEEKPGLDAYGIHHVELLSQYVLKSSEAESSQAMQTVATAHLRFLGSRKGGTGAKKVENESFESEGESLLYNAEMELQEKCFYMFGDDATDERRCIGQQQQQQQSGAAAGTPYPLNYPNSEAKVGRAVQMLRMVVQEQQQQQQVGI